MTENYHKHRARCEEEDPREGNDTSPHDAWCKPSREKVISSLHVRGMLNRTKPSDDPENEAIFTYGLLQPGESLYEVLSHHVKGVIVDACVFGYRMYASSFPYAVAGEAADRVWGTLLFLEGAAAIFPRIDEVEAAYDRVIVEARTPNYKIKAWIYVYNDKPHGELIESGDFIAWRDRL